MMPVAKHCSKGPESTDTTETKEELKQNNYTHIQEEVKQKLEKLRGK